MTIDDFIDTYKSYAIDYRKEAYYMSDSTQQIDYAIDKAREYEQLAEWLESSKAYEKQHQALCERYDVNTIEDIYNKAIDDFVEKMELKYLGVHPDELHEPHYAYKIIDDVKKIAEQLKKGE